MAAARRWVENEAAIMAMDDEDDEQQRLSPDEERRQRMLDEGARLQRLSPDEERMQRMLDEGARLQHIEDTMRQQEAEMTRIEAFIQQELANREDDETILAALALVDENPAAFGGNPQDPISIAPRIAAPKPTPKPRPTPVNRWWSRSPRSPSPRSSDTWEWIQTCVGIYEEQERARHADLDREDDALVELGRRWDDEDAAHTPSWANIDGDSTVDDGALVDEAFNAVEPYALPPRCLHLSL